MDTGVKIDLRSAGWQTFGNHHWKGYAWLDNEPWNPSDYRGETLVDLASRLNGCFSWVGEREGTSFALNDPLGSYALFYSQERITDRLEPADIEPNTDWLNSEFWRFSEALPGDRTLDDRYRSLLPGHLLRVQGKAFTLRPTGAYSGHADEIYPEEVERANFFTVINNCCRRLITHAAGRPIIVLLSDGYDSRLLLATLSLLRCPNLYAATYGIPGNGVVERAGEVAHVLGVPWRFINYGDADHASFLKTFYPRLVRLAANAQSVPQEQEFYAAHRLAEVFPAGSILVPGISGDLQAGSYVPPYSFRWPLNRRPAALVEWLRTRLTRIPATGMAKRLWKENVTLTGGMMSEREAVAQTERVIVNERLSKYLCTTLRGFEMMDFDWYLPLWDREFISFWERQPLDRRRFRRAYREWCKQDFFSPLSIHFSGEGERPRIHLGRILRRFLPGGQHLVGGVPDPNEFSKTIADLVGKPVESTEVNAALGEWLISYYSNRS